MATRFIALAIVAFLAAPLGAVASSAGPAPLALQVQSSADYPLGTWRMFHGNPEHTGEGYTTLPPLGHVVWQYNGSGSDKPEGGAAVDGGVVYCGLGSSMMAFNETSGQRLWSYYAGGRIFSTPALYNGIVYFGVEGSAGQKNFFALYAGNGTLSWNSNESASLGTLQFVHASPAVVNGLVYYGSYTYWLYARDAVTGGLAWSANLSSEVIASPAVSGDIVYASSAGIHNPVTSAWDVQPRLWAFNATTGQELWNQTITQGHLMASPVVAGGAVYAATAGFTYFTADYDAGFVLAFDAVTGSPLWTSPDVGRMIATPAVYGSIMYVAGAGDQAGGITSTTARLRWLNLSASGAQLLEAPVGDNASMESSPAAVGGSVVAAARDGTVARFLASGARLWSFKLPQDVIAPVAVADEMIFVPALDGKLYAFGAQPDFSVDPADVRLDDLTAHAGEPLTLRVTVHNLGDKKGSGVATAEANQSGVVTPIATWNLTDLDKFSQVTLTAPVRFAADGEATITVTLSGVAPADGNPLNNVALSTVMIWPALTGWVARYGDPHGSNYLETDSPQNNVLLWRQDAFNVSGGGFIAYGPTLVFSESAGNRVIAVPRARGNDTVTWVWNAPAPLVGSPALVNGYIAVATADPADPAGNVTFLDADTGLAVRTVALGTHPTTSGVPHDDFVLFGATDRLVELSSATLAVERELPTVDVPLTARPALPHEPVVAAGWAFVVSSVGELHAFNLTTGSEPGGWPVQLAATTDVPLVAGVSFLYAVNGPDNLSAFSLASLSAVPVWNTSIGGNVTGAMALAYGRLFVPTTVNVTALVSGSGAVAWEQALTPAQPANAVRAAGNNSVYAGSERLFSLSAATGAREWEFSPGADGAFSGSAALEGGTLHLQTSLGHIVTLGLTPGRPPTAVIESPVAGRTYRAGEAVTFSSNGTSDPDNEELQYFWDFGDGNVSGNASATHIYGFPGDLRVRLTVLDGLLLPSSVAVDIHIIENRAPDLFVTSGDQVQPDITRQNLDDTVWTFKVRYRDPDNDPPTWISLNITNEADGAKPMLPVGPGPYDFANGVDYSWTGTLTSGYHNYTFAASDGLAEAPSPGNNRFPIYRIETREAPQFTYSIMYVGTGTSSFAAITGTIPPSEYQAIDKFSITLPANATNLQWITIEFRYGAWVNVSQFLEDTIGIYSRDRGANDWQEEASHPDTDNNTVSANISLVGSSVFTVENELAGATAIFGVFGKPTQTPNLPIPEISTGGRTLFAPGEQVVFSCEGSVETNGLPASTLICLWDFGDGSATATGAVVNHSYAAANQYQVELTVINSFGQNATMPYTVTVRSPESTSTFLGLAALIVGALFALAVVWPVSRRRGKSSGPDAREKRPPPPTERTDRPSGRRPRAVQQAPDEAEGQVVDELEAELENGRGDGR